MKKTILFAVAAMIMAAMVFVFVCVNNERNSMDELFNANVEALANDEGGLGNRMCVPNSVLGDTPYILCYSCRLGRTTIYSYSYCNY